MVVKFSAEINKVYFINKYSLFHILEGEGGIQVDFKIYHNWKDKLIFLDKGQYIKFLTDNFIVRKIEFPDEVIFKNEDIRVLFKHLVSLGYINFNECEACQQYLSNTVFTEQKTDIIDISSKQWFWQNPFAANKEEYHLIFDVKDVIDANYKNHLTNDSLSSLIKSRGYQAQALFKSKIGLSVKSMLQRKKILESKREIAFSDKSVKEVSYELGFNDPAYFNRFFKKNAGKSPGEFRKEFETDSQDLFVQDLYELLHTYHKEERSLAFYADEMRLPIKTLSRRVKDKLNISLGQLIRLEIVNSAKELLSQGEKVNEIAYTLGFEEANHFTSFFKQHTGMPPSKYKK